MSFCPPDQNCSLCPRLAEFRAQNRQKFPNYHNGPVESFGELSAQILVVGMAPGLNGANRTNRPFTNDYAGDILYPALQKFGFARGTYQKRRDDGFVLENVRVTNAVRCVPPQNKVTGAETATCKRFLAAEIAAMTNLKIILCLGTVSHAAVLKVLGCRQAAYKFSHNAVHHLKERPLIMVDSYHTSRYNINTGVLSREMFENVVKNMKELLEINV